MPQPKTPASSLSGRLTAHSSLLRLTTITAAVIELLTKRVLHRIRGTRSADGSNKISPTPSSPATKLPPEIVEMVIAHIHDKHRLLAFSLTCRSWYITSISHLHHTFVIPTNGGASAWPKQLRSMHKRGLLPLVKKFQISLAWNSFFPKRFDCRTLRHFWALTNVQELRIDFLDIPSFIPRIRRYFKHLSPTVRSLSMRAPRGSHREIIYFIGIFQRLEDLKLLYDHSDDRSYSSFVYAYPDPQDEPADDDDATLVPPFIPPLRGRLTMFGLRRTGFLKEMIDLFGGIRFCYMDIYNVAETQLLLGACAKTLKTLRLYPTDPRGKQLLLEMYTSSNQQFRSYIPSSGLRSIPAQVASDTRDQGAVYLRLTSPNICTVDHRVPCVLRGHCHLLGFRPPVAWRSEGVLVAPFAIRSAPSNASRAELSTCTVCTCSG
jgi:hypothetical protein